MFARNVLLFPHKPIEQFPRKKRRQILRDEGLVEKLGLRWEAPGTLTVDQSERVADLYNQLYLEKYSENNPRFTPLFHAECSSRNILHYRLLMDGGSIIGVVGMKVVEGVSTTPILGYDHHHPHAKVLYRMLTAKITRPARITISTGTQVRAPTRSRNYEAVVTNEEFTMVKTSHLSWWRRLNWGIIRFIAQKSVGP